MQIPAILQVESLTRLMQGVAIGAVATIFVGFSLGGWVTGGTARKMAQRDIGDATITALVPICAEKFQNHADAVMNLTTLKKIGFWQQAFFSDKGRLGNDAGSAIFKLWRGSSLCGDAWEPESREPKMNCVTSQNMQLVSQNFKGE